MNGMHKHFKSTCYWKLLFATFLAIIFTFSIIELTPIEKGPLCHLIECVQVLQLMSPEHMRGNMLLHQKVPGKSSL